MSDRSLWYVLLITCSAGCASGGATRAVAETATMSQYAALFYGGPEPEHRNVPSCDQVSRILRASF